MKSLLLVLFVLLPNLWQGSTLNAQSISCQELYDFIVEEYDSKDQVTCYGSSMLTKVTRYTYDGNGFVVAFIKQNDYDFRGSPYIFCGVSSWTWSSFKISGMGDSWGEAFHEYIFGHKCACY